MELAVTDQQFLAEYIKSVEMVINNGLGYVGGVVDLDLRPRFISKFNENFGITENERSRILQDPRINTYRRLAISERRIVKLLAVRSFPDSGAKMLVANLSPIINPTTNNIVGILGLIHNLEIFNLSSIIAQYYKSGELSVPTLDNVTLTEREKQTIFFFLLNLDSKSIAEILSRIEAKRISKNSLDQMFNKQLFPKFGVYNRKALYDKLIALGYNRLMPKNVLNDGILLEITDYVVFN